MTGSQHNDPFYMEDGAVRTRTNRCVLARGAGGGGRGGGRGGGGFDRWFALVGCAHMHQQVGVCGALLCLGQVETGCVGQSVVCL
jgi:hypothetical protein